MIFADRYDAGQRLVAILEPYRAERPVVLGLPRGGVAVAAEVARGLEAPLDVLVVRKLGAPGAPEFAIGAIAPGSTLLNMELIEHLRVSRDYLAHIIATATEELHRQERAYRGDRPALDVERRTVIVVDDGLATGATAQAAVDALHRRRPRRIVFAAPVCSVDGAAALANRADAVVCLERPYDLRSVGEWYHDFTPTSDAEVLKHLRASEGGEGCPMTPLTMMAGERAAHIPAGEPQLQLEGMLAWPTRPSGVVLFAHGSGSGRSSPRNLYVARQLRLAGLATLLFDLLTETEAADRRNVFDIPLLARRLLAGGQWVAHQPETTDLPMGLFGASTGAAAALIAAATAPDAVGAVVSRGGRPDLAGDSLRDVQAPTLLLVGSQDLPVLDLNHSALARLGCPKRLVVISGATHLFEEPGTLEEVARWAAEWFVHYLAMTRTWRERGR